VTTAEKGVKKKIGECIVCGKTKHNLTAHHVKELNREIMIMCRDCHDVITWYQDKAIPKFKTQLKKKK